jgi:two-component system chemotaxis sensor kinase CheA
MTMSRAELVERLRALAARGADREAGSVSPATELAAADPAPPPAGSDEPRARSLRVSLETLDRILDLTGEIAVGRERLRGALEGGTHEAAAAAEIHREADRLHADLQELVMKARMEPLGPTFRRLARMVRDLAGALGKSARLVIEGGEVEVDTKVVELVRDPLTHLVRNALSHGLETPGERAERGKDPCGRIVTRAFRETGGIVIEVEDDGGGLSRERILRRAREKGLAMEAHERDEAELQRLIFSPGFSTAAAVTEVSGRGVGLDVVRRNVEALRGSVGVRSREGKGTTFTIRLPLSLAIIPGFAVESAGETYIVPLEAVLECLELPKDGLEGREGGVGSLRGDSLPYLRLRERFDLPAEHPAREYVVVVQHEGKRLGLVVDGLLGESQTVLKPLGRPLGGVEGIAGSAILGSGRVALVVDLPGFFRDAAS